MEPSEARCENCIVRQLNALNSLKKEELKRISDSKESRTIKKGEVLFKEGERLNGVFCVRDGISKLSKASDNGKDQIVKLVTKGEIIGQRSVVVDEYTNLSAVAVNDMQVCFFPKSEFERSLNENTQFTKAILKHMAAELKEADDIIVGMAQKSVKQRMAAALLHLEDTYKTDHNGYLKVILTREDIANLVGTAKEACIRTLTTFKNDGLIATEGKRIKLTNKKALYNMVEGF